MLRLTSLALFVLVAAPPALAQFQCGIQLSDGESVTISQQYVAAQPRCTITGPATGTATIISTVTDTQAIVLDDDSTGEIVLSGSINFVSSVTSAPYSSLCDPAAFIATNGNVTISNGASIQFNNNARNPGPVICAQNVFIMGIFDVSHTSFNGQVIYCQHSLTVGPAATVVINDVMGSAIVAGQTANIQGSISAKNLCCTSDGGLIRGSHVLIQEGAIISVFNASVFNSGGLFTGDSVTIAGKIVADTLHSDNAAGVASSDNIVFARSGSITVSHIDNGDGGGIFAGGNCVIDGSITASDITLGAQGGIASCNNISITGHINATRLFATIGGAVFAANYLSILKPATIITSDSSTPNIGGFAWVQGDVFIGDGVTIDASDSKAAKVAGAIWADRKIEMSGAYNLKFQGLQATGSCAFHSDSGSDIILSSSGTLLIQDCLTFNSSKVADIYPGIAIDGTPQPLSPCNACMRTHSARCGCSSLHQLKLTLPPFSECCS